MTRPAGSACLLRPRSRRAFTLIEVLVATTLTLMMIGAVVSVFEMVSNSVSDARSTLEMTDRLRGTTMQLQRDLAGVTVTMLPPRRPEDNEGYFEFVENSIYARSGTRFLPPNESISYSVNPVNTDDINLVIKDDNTATDHDDILMFTTRSPDRPFIGRFGTTSTSIESQLAEVAWFVRGRTLYRRQLLVLPNVALPSTAPQGFYANYDVSVHLNPSTRVLVPNTLGDLTKREYRFAHPCLATELISGRTGPQQRPPFPYDIRYWNRYAPGFGLPTVAETSSNYWLACETFPAGLATISPGRNLPTYQCRSNAQFNPQPPYYWEDLWSGPDGILTDNVSLATAFATANQYRMSNPYHMNLWDNNAQRRASEDAILTNVIGFDVKVWDPGAPLFYRSYTGGRDKVLAPGDPGYPTPTDGAVNWTVYGYGAYVDLGYYPYCPIPLSGRPRRQFHVVAYDNNNPNTADNFFTINAPRSGLQRTYDTWSTHYDSDGISQFGGTKLDWATDGFDNDLRNGIDDPGERETIPPYPYPLRSIQVKIRCFDNDSRQIREMTIVQDFLP